MRRRGVFAAAMAALLITPAAAAADELPPGAVKSSNLTYEKWVPDTKQVVEGKFDTVRGTDIMVLSGRFGFKTFDVEDPTNPKPLDAFLPPGLEQNGYWQNEDMELDTKRKLIIGALDPRHRSNPADPDCPGTGTTGNPGCESGFFVISYADPKNL